MLALEQTYKKFFMAYKYLADRINSERYHFKHKTAESLSDSDFDRKRLLGLTSLSMLYILLIN